jgi:hypothetical protein
LEQFRWISSFNLEGGLKIHDRLPWVLGMLRWAQPWVLVLVVTAVAAAGAWAVNAPRPGEPREEREQIWMTAAVFGAAGIVTLVHRSVLPYYLVFFSTWPIIVLAMLPHLRPAESRPLLRAGALAAVTIVGVAWSASMAWNTLRFRERVLFYQRLDPVQFTRVIDSIVPKSAAATGSKELVMAARAAGLAFEPPPWLERNFWPASDHWVLLSERDLELQAGRMTTGRQVEEPPFHPDAIAERAVAYDGPAVPDGGKYFSYRVVILKPLTPVAANDSPGELALRPGK